MGYSDYAVVSGCPISKRGSPYSLGNINLQYDRKGLPNPFVVLSLSDYFRKLAVPIVRRMSMKDEGAEQIQLTQAKL
jgi:hypothetical protein